MKNSVEVPQKNYDPAILLLGIYSKDIKSPSKRDSFTPMFIEALFTVAKIGNNPSVH